MIINTSLLGNIDIKDEIQLLKRELSQNDKLIIKKRGEAKGKKRTQSNFPKPSNTKIK